MMKTPFVVFALSFLLVLDTAAQVPSFQWAGRLGSTGQDVGQGIAVDGAGNSIVVGIFEGTVDGDPGPGVSSLVSAGDKDVFIIKVDGSGNHVWSRRIGGAQEDLGNSIAVDAAGNSYIAGLFRGTVDLDPGAAVHDLTSVGYLDIFLLKLDVDGDFVWAHRIGSQQPEECEAVTVDALGNIILTGTINETADVDPGATSSMLDAGPFVLKLDSDGQFVWAQRVTDGGGTIFGVRTDASGAVYTTGRFYNTGDFDPGAGAFMLTSVGIEDIFVSKLDAGGAFVWARAMGGDATDQGQAIAVDASSNVFITGYFNGTCNFDPGVTDLSLTAVNAWQGFTLRLDADGGLAWVFPFGGTTFGTSDVGFGIAVDDAGMVYVTGNILGSSDFDPGPATVTLSTGSNTGIFVHSLTGDGAFNWAFQVSAGSFNYNSGRAIAVDAQGNARVTGSFVSANVDFDPGTSVHALSSAAGYDAFVLGVGPGTTTGMAEVATSSALPFPDPAHGEFTLPVKEVRNARLLLVDAAGRAVFASALRSGANTVRVPALLVGVFTYVVVDEGEEILRGRIVLE